LAVRLTRLLNRTATLPVSSRGVRRPSYLMRKFLIEKTTLLRLSIPKTCAGCGKEATERRLELNTGIWSETHHDPAIGIRLPLCDYCLQVLSTTDEQELSEGGSPLAWLLVVTLAAGLITAVLAALGPISGVWPTALLATALLIGIGRMFQRDRFIRALPEPQGSQYRQVRYGTQLHKLGNKLCLYVLNSRFADDLVAANPELAKTMEKIEL
jgi:hypothetical protein